MKQPIPKKRRDSIIAKMTGPNKISIPEIAKLENIPLSTLYYWKKEAKLKGVIMPDYDDSPDGWSARDKFKTVLQTATMSETEISVFCREKGLYPSQIQQWRETCELANDWDNVQKREQNKLLRAEKTKSQKLQKELLRKDKALAEAAALLILQKKVRAIWEDEDA
jgi:hypothetical protein